MAWKTKSKKLPQVNRYVPNLIIRIQETIPGEYTRAYV